MITIPNLKVGIFHQLQSNSEAALQKMMRMCNYSEESALIYILAYENTVDIQWVENALELLNADKIQYENYRNYIN